MGEDDRETSLEWRAGDVPVSRCYEDPFYSLADGLAESRHVFLGGCGLPGAWAGRDTYRIAELGFGTGLNALAALALWRETAQPDAVLEYTGFEIAPLPADDIARALARWPELDREGLLGVWGSLRRGGTAWIGPMRLTVVVGDARETLPGWQGEADAWFLDGFAPARNPELWGPPLLAHVARTSVPQGRFATYTAAGAVRRALGAAGFTVIRDEGFGAKRHMLRGYNLKKT